MIAIKLLLYVMIHVCKGLEMLEEYAGTECYYQYQSAVRLVFDSQTNKTVRRPCGPTESFSLSFPSPPNYVGCFKAEDILPGLHPLQRVKQHSMSIDFCSTYCSKIPYYLMQNGNECRCAYEIILSAKVNEYNYCLKKCVDHGYCGDMDHVSIYANIFRLNSMAAITDKTGELIDSDEFDYDLTCSPAFLEPPFIFKFNTLVIVERAIFYLKKEDISKGCQIDITCLDQGNCNCYVSKSLRKPGIYPYKCVTAPTRVLKLNMASDPQQCVVCDAEIYGFYFHPKA
jgi:hypothetical protein